MKCPECHNDHVEEVSCKVVDYDNAIENTYHCGYCEKDFSSTVQRTIEEKVVARRVTKISFSKMDKSFICCLTLKNGGVMLGGSLKGPIEAYRIAFDLLMKSKSKD